MLRNEMLNKIYMPKLESVGSGFFNINKEIKELELDSLKKAADDFLAENTNIEYIYLN